MNPLSPQKFVWHILVALLLIILNALPAASQDKRTKVRISNAGLTITALPLLAARDWGTFTVIGLDVEIVVMSLPLGAAAMNQGDIENGADDRVPTEVAMKLGYKIPQYGSSFVFMPAGEQKLIAHFVAKRFFPSTTKTLLL